MVSYVCAQKNGQRAKTLIVTTTLQPTTWVDVALVAFSKPPRLVRKSFQFTTSARWCPKKCGYTTWMVMEKPYG